MAHNRPARALPGLQPPGLPGISKPAPPAAMKGGINVAASASAPAPAPTSRVGLSPRGTLTYTQPAPGVNVLEEIFASVSPKTPEDSSAETLKKRVGAVEWIEGS